MVSIYLKLYKYFSQHNMFNVMKFIKDSIVRFLTFVKSKSDSNGYFEIYYNCAILINQIL